MATINGQRVQVVAVAQGLRALGGVVHVAFQREHAVFGVKADVLLIQTVGDDHGQTAEHQTFLSQYETVRAALASDNLDAAKKAGIPIVFVNRNPKIAGVPYVGSDSIVSGTLEMEQLAKLAGGKGDVVILEGQVSNEAAVLRTQGCNDVVGKNPGMKVVDTQVADWDRAKAQAVAENWIQSGKLKAGMVVCANNDEMALGAINAIKAAGIPLTAGDGILGSAVIQERVTDLLDVPSIIRRADPAFYETSIPG